MKWNNKGHQYDGLCEYMRGVKTVYLYGCAAKSISIITHMEWLLEKVNDNYLTIKFVDADPAIQNSVYYGKQVISPEEFYEAMKIEPGLVVVCVSEKNSQDIFDKLEKNGIKRRFNSYSYYEFMRYMSLFAKARYDILYLHLVDNYVHTNCNINCKDCFIQNYRGVRKHADIITIEKNIDMIFKKADYVGIIICGIADAFCGGSEIAHAVQYIANNYSDRCNSIQLVTNGTVIPTDKLIESIKHQKISIVISDYRENVELARKNYDVVIKKLEDNGVNYSALPRVYWYDPQFGSYSKEETEAELVDKYEDCICESKGFPYVGYKEGTFRFYPCIFQTINSYLNLVGEDDCDSLDMEKSDDMEIIEFLLGSSEKGYLSACKKCTGMFEGIELNHVPVAVQMKE